MFPEYFPNQDLMCFGSALANYLLEIGDQKTAKLLYDSYLEHPLVSAQGVLHAGLSTRVLRDLTRNRYDGKLYANFGDDLEETTRKFYPGQSDEILKITKEERDSTHIVSHDGVIHYTYPVLFLIPRRIGHWVVGIADNVYIDNGWKKSAVNPLNVLGVLVVNKKT